MTCAVIVGVLGATATRAHAQVTGHEAVTFCINATGDFVATGTGFTPGLVGANVWEGAIVFFDATHAAANNSEQVNIDAGGGFTASFRLSDLEAASPNFAVTDAHFELLFGPITVTSADPCSSTAGSYAAPSIDTHPPSLTNAASGTFTFTGAAGASFQCSLDGGAYAPCSSPFSTGPLADGGHTFNVTQSDSTHPVSAPAPFSWTVDTTPPAAPVFTSVPPDPAGSSAATFGYTVEGGATATCMLDGVPVSCTPTGASLSGLSAGPHTFSVFATDAAGNAGPPASDTWTINASYAAPSIDTHPPSLTNVASAMFTFTGVSGAILQCSVDGGAYAPCTSPFSTGPLADGAHTFSVTQSDSLHPVSAPASFGWTVDTTPPAAPDFTSMPANPTGSSAASFTYTVEGGAAVTCMLDGSPVSCSPAGAAITGLAPGTHTFQVFATDPAGNAGPPASYTWTINAPYAAPTILTHPTSPTNTTTATFTFTGASGASFMCSLDGGTYAACTSPFATGTLAEGVHTFSVTQADETHPVSPAASFTWTVDTTPPNTPVFTHVPTSPTVSTTAAFTYTADTGSIVMCILDSTPVTCSATGLTLSGLSVGDHTFQVYAMDAAGNIGQPATYSWTIAAPTSGCSRAGDVNGGLNVKGGLRINVEADCDAADKKHPVTYLHHGHIHVDGLGLKIDANTNSDGGKKGDLTGVTFVSNTDGSVTATLTGMWNGKPFTLTVTDAGKKPKGQDSFRFVYNGVDYGLQTTTHGNAKIDLE